MRYSASIRVGLFCMMAVALVGAADVGDSPTPYAGWPNSFPADENFFPLAVWLQSPGNAQAFKNLGINTYVGLWDGPTESQLSSLKTAGMSVVCDQNSLALSSPSRSISMSCAPGLSLAGVWSPFLELSVGVAPHSWSVSDRFASANG